MNHVLMNMSMDQVIMAERPHHNKLQQPTHARMQANQ